MLNVNLPNFLHFEGISSTSVSNVESAPIVTPVATVHLAHVTKVVGHRCHFEVLNCRAETSTLRVGRSLGPTQDTNQSVVQ